MSNVGASRIRSERAKHLASQRKKKQLKNNETETPKEMEDSGALMKSLKSVKSGPVTHYDEKGGVVLYFQGKAIDREKIESTGGKYAIRLRRQSTMENKVIGKTNVLHHATMFINRVFELEGPNNGLMIELQQYHVGDKCYETISTYHSKPKYKSDHHHDVYNDVVKTKSMSDSEDDNDEVVIDGVVYDDSEDEALAEASEQDCFDD